MAGAPADATDIILEKETAFSKKETFETYNSGYTLVSIAKVIAESSSS